MEVTLDWLNDNAGAVTAIATVLLAIITAIYVGFTRSLSKRSTQSALAAERSASAAEQALRVSSTPVVLWDSLVLRENPGGFPEIEYRLHNAGPVAAIDVYVAAIRYPVDHEPIQTPFRESTELIAPNHMFPLPEAQESSFVIPSDGNEREQWLIAGGNNSYGLVVMYRDPAGRIWRSELSQETPRRFLFGLDQSGSSD